MKWRKGDFPITEEIAETIISLPMDPHLSQAERIKVIDGVKAFAQTS